MMKTFKWILFWIVLEIVIFIVTGLYTFLFGGADINSSGYLDEVGLAPYGQALLLGLMFYWFWSEYPGGRRRLENLKRLARRQRPTTDWVIVGIIWFVSIVATLYDLLHGGAVWFASMGSVAVGFVLHGALLNVVLPFLRGERVLDSWYGVYDIMPSYVQPTDPRYRKMGVGALFATGFFLLLWLLFVGIIIAVYFLN